MNRPISKPAIITTGATGLVGTRITELLKDRFNFIDLSLPQNDLLKPETLEPVFKNYPQAQAVFHLAAYTDVAKAWEQRGDKQGLCWQVNVSGTKNLADLCQKYQKYLVYISTDFVFDGQKEGNYTEEDSPHPLDWYGQTKYEGEKIVSRLPRHAIARIAFPYRSHFPDKPDIIRRLLEKIKEGSLHPMFTDQITTPTFIDDLALAIEQFFLKKPQGIYHLVGSSSQSPYEMARQISEVFGFDPAKVQKSSLAEYVRTQGPDARPWPINLAISNQKVIRELGVRFATLRQGLETLKIQLNS